MTAGHVVMMVAVALAGVGLWRFMSGVSTGGRAVGMLLVLAGGVLGVLQRFVGSSLLRRRVPAFDDVLPSQVAAWAVVVAALGIGLWLALPRGDARGRRVGIAHYRCRLGARGLESAEVRSLHRPLGYCLVGTTAVFLVPSAPRR